MPIPEAHPDPEAMREAVRMYRTMLTGDDAEPCAGCEMVLDALDRADPDKRRRITHQLISAGFGWGTALAGTIGQTFGEFLDRVEAQLPPTDRAQT